MPTEGQTRQDTGKVPEKATIIPTEGQTKQDTGKVKQCLTEGDMKEFKKKKITKNTTEIIEEYKMKKADIQNGIKNTEGRRKNKIDMEAEIADIEDHTKKRTDKKNNTKNTMIMAEQERIQGDIAEVKQ